MVIIHHLIAEGTVDERVMKVLAGKATLQDELMEAVKAC
jgi:SNF2 family DNA or RNA helicase